MRYDWFKQFSINLSRFFDSVKFRSGSGSGYHLVIDFCLAMFYMLMILMKFRFVPQTFFRIFFFQGQDQDPEQDQDFTIKFIGKSYFLYTKDIHEIWCRSAKFLWKSKFCLGSGSGSGSWFYFGIQYQTYISYIDDTHQILFGNSFASYCVHIESTRAKRQTGRQTKIFLCLFCLLRHTKHEHSSKGEIFFSTHAITILSLFTYSVCDEKVKKPSGLKKKSLFFNFPEEK